jgi:peptidoglycan/LPS O-acetylase OafA/YrhL
MLIMRAGLRLRLPAGFGLCSLMLIAALCLPRIGLSQHLWQNGLYDALCILLVFPVVVAAGAGSSESEGRMQRVCRFLGQISYPLYITHYPLIYLYTAYTLQHKTPPLRGAVLGVLLFVTAMTVATLCLRFYDEPVRRWLSAKWLRLRQPV